MKPEISVFMAIKNSFMGFFKAFSWDFLEKEIHSDLLSKILVNKTDP